MRPIVVVLIVLALGAAAIAAYLANQWVKSNAPAPAPAAQQQVNTTDVLVAAKDILPGTVLTQDDLRWQPWPSTALPAATGRAVSVPARR